MATDKKAFTMRLEPQNYEKFLAISKKNAGQWRLNLNC